MNKNFAHSAKASLQDCKPITSALVVRRSLFSTMHRAPILPLLLPGGPTSQIPRSIFNVTGEQVVNSLCKSCPDARLVFYKIENSRDDEAYCPLVRL